MAGILDSLAGSYDFSPTDLERIVQIESGGNPQARTGSYKGLFQLSDSEFNKYGGGNIYNAEDNARAGVAKLAAERDRFTEQYGRPPEPYELYLIHQQGEGGFAQHYTNPDQPAWKSMYSTGEGQQKGQGWAKQAIWGNVPDQMKAQFGNVDNITSQQFMDLWRNKVQGGDFSQRATGSPAGIPVQAQDIPASPLGLPGKSVPVAGSVMAAIPGGNVLSALLGGFQGAPPSPVAPMQAPTAQFAPLQLRPMAQLRIPPIQAPYGIGRA